MLLFVFWLLLCSSFLPSACRRMDAKRARLLSCLRRPGVHDEAVQFLTADSADPIEQYHLEKFLAAEFKDVEMELSIPTETSPLKLKIFRPAPLVQWFVQECPAYGELLASLAGPTKVLRLMLYLDEVTPGNPIRPDHGSKFYIWYFSFREFGKRNIYMESVWLPFAAVRTKSLKEVRAGVSGLMRYLTRAFFEGEPNFRSGFALIPYAVLLRARMDVLVADWAALQAVWKFMGANGLKCCAECNNVFSKDSDLDLPGSVTIACHDPSAFVASTDEDAWSAHAYLATQKPLLTKTRFEIVEKAAGLRFEPHGLMADEPVRAYIQPISNYCGDWPHLLVSQGVFQVEMHLLFERFNKRQKTRGNPASIYSLLHKVAQADWRFPYVGHNSAAGAAKQIFTEGREKASKDSTKIYMSEAFLAYPIIRYFLQSTAVAALRAEYECAYALFELLDAVLGVKKNAAVNRGELIPLWSKHLRLFTAVYGLEHVIPKHHAVYHVLLRHSREDDVPDSVSLERKHKKAKSFANQHSMHARLEEYVLTSCVMDQRRMLLQNKLADGLLGDLGRGHVAGFAARLAKQVFFHGCTFSIGDIVLVEAKQYIMQVTKIFAAGARFYLFGPELTPRCLHPGASVCNKGDRELCLELDVALHATLAYCWSSKPDGSLLVLHRTGARIML